MPAKAPRAAHRVQPCGHPTRSGAPCPNRAVDSHAVHGPVCRLHAHQAARSADRTATVLVRLTPREKRLVEAAGAVYGVSLSDLGRALLSGVEPPPPPTPRVDVRLHADLGRVGGLLNQLAHGVNIAQSVGETPELGGLAERLDELQGVLQSIRRELAGLPA